MYCTESKHVNMMNTEFINSIAGEVRYSRNNHKIATLMHVDRTLPLWAFFDVYGNVQKIKLLGRSCCDNKCYRYVVVQ